MLALLALPPLFNATHSRSAAPQGSPRQNTARPTMTLGRRRTIDMNIIINTTSLFSRVRISLIPPKFPEKQPHAARLIRPRTTHHARYFPAYELGVIAATCCRHRHTGKYAINGHTDDIGATSQIPPPHAISQYAMLCKLFEKLVFIIK